MNVAITALLSVLVGLALVGVIGICIAASELADLKAYTITAIDLLAQLKVQKPVATTTSEKSLVKHTSDGVVITHPVHARVQWLISWSDASVLHAQLGSVLDKVARII